MEQKERTDVPIAKRRRNRPVSSLKTRVEMLDQKRALNPKAASGKAVAVPRWSGKFEAAVLMAAPKAEQPPVPVKKAKKHMKKMGTEPGPL
jgi:hypothetical protein